MNATIRRQHCILHVLTTVTSPKIIKILELKKDLSILVIPALLGHYRFTWMKRRLPTPLHLILNRGRSGLQPAILFTDRVNHE